MHASNIIISFSDKASVLEEKIIKAHNDRDTYA
jgi:hypothetical protein